MPFNHSSAEGNQVRLAHPWRQQRGSMPKLNRCILYEFQSQGSAVSQDPAPSTLSACSGEGFFLPPTADPPPLLQMPHFWCTRPRTVTESLGFPQELMGTLSSSLQCPAFFPRALGKTKKGPFVPSREEEEEEQRQLPVRHGGRCFRSWTDPRAQSRKKRRIYATGRLYFPWNCCDPFGIRPSGILLGPSPPAPA